MTGPLHFEPAAGTPLVWFSAVTRVGAALDPPGREGLTRHTAELARRGAGGMDRAALDAAIDQVGAAVQVEVDRDWLGLSGTCLERHLDRTLGLASSVLADPILSQREHEVLLRETRHELDDVRDDDFSLADRHFHRVCAPGHPYARTTLGTEPSLARIELGPLADYHRSLWAPDHLIVGVAGPIAPARAERVADSLRAAVGGRRGATPPPLDVPPFPTGRRLILVDKPKRTQCQIVMGHLAPAYGSDDFVALMPLETAFGGLFTSRLMQEIRVARGWSYGAGCRMVKGKVPHWFRMWLAPTADVAPEALALTLSLYEQLAAGGLTRGEFDLAIRNLTGSLPFARATARQRMRLALRHELVGLPVDFPARLPALLAALSPEHVHAAAGRWLRPADLCIVMVASADEMVPRLEQAGFAPAEVVAYDSY
ncbi:MAG TPA: pitrilysin family protein [Kofleriaceae bacterium]|nr:pitrilysin family protein [Kofleriaceae bacterium]